MKKAKLFLIGTVIVAAVTTSVAFKAHANTSPNLLICNPTTDQCELSDYSSLNGSTTTFKGPFYEGSAGQTCETSGCEEFTPAHIYLNE